MTLNFIIFQEKPYTVALLVDDAMSIRGAGIAKWNPQDKDKPGWEWDEWAGIEIATMRCALQYHQARLNALLGQDPFPRCSQVHPYGDRIKKLADSLGIGAEDVRRGSGATVVDDPWERLIKDIVAHGR